MGLKFIDIDESARALIGRLVELRRPTLPGIDDFDRLPLIDFDPLGARDGERDSSFDSQGPDSDFGPDSDLPDSAEGDAYDAADDRDSSLPFDLVKRKEPEARLRRRRVRSRKPAILVMGLALAAGFAFLERGPIASVAVPKVRGWATAALHGVH
jgi:hypothetical protein